MKLNVILTSTRPGRNGKPVADWFVDYAKAHSAGFEVVLVDVSEFHKGGGSIRCLTNPVDLRIGRDLAVVPGGEVVRAA